MKFSFNSDADGVGLSLDSDNRRILFETLGSWHDALPQEVAKQVELIHVRPSQLLFEERICYGIRILIKLADMTAPALADFRSAKREVEVYCKVAVFTSREKTHGWISAIDTTTPADVMKDITSKLRQLLRDEMTACEKMKKRNEAMLCFL